MADQMKAWLAERNAVLLAGNVDAMIAHMRKWGSPVPSDRNVAEVTLHKARTACLALPMAERSKSKFWLVARGYTTMDEGDVPLVAGDPSP